MAIIYSIYCRYNKSAIEEGRRYLASMSVEGFYDSYLKATLEKYPDLSIIKQNNDMIDILCQKRGKTYFFRYHRCCLVTVEQYEMFLSTAEKQRARRAFYITCGSFDHSLVKANRNSMFLMESRIFLIDGLHIIKKVIGVRRKWSARKKRLKMIDLYLP